MSRAVDSDDPYVLKIVKLIPAEVSAAYLAINGYLATYSVNLPILIGCGVVLMAVCYALIHWQSQSHRQAIVTCIAFVIWAVNISAAIYGTSNEIAIVASILVLSTLLLPRLMPAQT